MLILACGAPLSGTWKGYVSDLKCGAMVDAACNKRCMEEGQSAVLVQDETGDILQINNTDAVKDHAGAHVQIKGTIKNGVITVREVKPVEK